jgi:uncharacterized membrane protein YagU involved in acid resistance
MSATNRVLLGVLAGIAATCAMTAAARALHRRLPADERYPLPPREIVESGLPVATKRSLDEHGRQTVTIAAHFGYGAATGVLYALAAPRGSILSGAAYGFMVWAVSYFGIMPGLRILWPAHDHPGRRNALMIAAHLVWGSALARTLRDLEFAERAIFAGDAAPDAMAPAPLWTKPETGLAALAEEPGGDTKRTYHVLPTSALFRACLMQRLDA